MKTSYYYYDHEAATFVEVQPKPKKVLLHSALVLALALVLAGAGMWAVYESSSTAKEIALESENESLRNQLATITEPELAIRRNAERVDSLANVIGSIDRPQVASSYFPPLPDSVAATVAELRDAVSTLQAAVIDKPEEAVGLIVIRKEVEFLRSRYEADINRLYQVVMWMGGIFVSLGIFVAGLAMKEQLRVSKAARVDNREGKDIAHE